ncbi:2-nitropropane dioxygenase [Colletotrichum sublineola]|uniref:Putative 2-nitropropane dioxygenase n=1 Tax=Colletotrichum sublineola TaxID=1173701 RepID=A0A066XG02_COLSU|nr:2-nitropropane dioxygenase [Colletotrichum sublineola]KDN67862.1 putative 2-nitropropane dioxygenase [Colletotrichum sublineola]
MSSSRLVSWFPHLKTPVIVNAPMYGSAGAAMATEVHKAGGLGFISAGFDFSESSALLKDLDGALAQARALLSLPAADGASALPIGVGFITSHESATRFNANVLPILTRHRVAAAWLFAPHPETRPHGDIIAALREQEIKVFVQVGNVAAAREAAAEGADVLVAQGVDAGGHQFARGCGVVALVPEVRAMLAAEFPGRDVAVAAAGGIVEGSGVAAALALGAEGVVMGTRFVATDEAASAQLHKDIIVRTRDGGLSTWKSDFHDKLVDSKLWKHGYDGRAVVGDIHREHHALGGDTATVEESRENLRTRWSEEEGKKMIGKWAGAGVGLVKEIKPAGEVVVEVREAARKRIQELAGAI